MTGFMLLKRRFNRVFGAEGKKSVQLQSVFVTMMRVTNRKEKKTLQDASGVQTADLTALTLPV